jgi:hypothetical protein
MADAPTLKDAITVRGPYAVWSLMSDDEKREAAIALWEHADRTSRAALEAALAQAMKFRTRSVRRLAADRVAPRLVRLADTLPENVLFQFLLHLHLAGRTELLVEFLDAVGLPHNEGVLDLPEDFESPAEEAVTTAATALVAAHGHNALIYLATLKVADADFWAGLDPVLETFTEDGEAAD